MVFSSSDIKPSTLVRVILKIKIIDFLFLFLMFVERIFYSLHVVFQLRQTSPRRKGRRQVSKRAYRYVGIVQN